jgi:hypothetical protein
VNRVAEVELDPNAKQSELVAAIHPVADRLLKQYQEARKRLRQAQSQDDADGEQKARDEMDALVLFRRNMGAYVRVYAFLSQIFDYGNTEIEKRAIFFRRLIPLLEFGREREEVDLSKVKLTHHSLRHTGTRQLKLGGETGKLQPLRKPGSGEVQRRRRRGCARSSGRSTNSLTGTSPRTTSWSTSIRVKTKLMESEILVQQARNNTKEQFANSPDLHQAVMNAIMDALSAHSTMSKQALDSHKSGEMELPFPEECLSGEASSQSPDAFMQLSLYIMHLINLQKSVPDSPAGQFMSGGFVILQFSVKAVQLPACFPLGREIWSELTRGLRWIAVEQTNEEWYEWGQMYQQVSKGASMYDFIYVPAMLVPTWRGLDDWAERNLEDAGRTAVHG